ncbi:hypothetical protein Tco_0892754 [Tanacetum coccineum]|uniref:Uncharacterized protein n=1 Tax=Tanacetum coccineum TaxID=301880 RepID=A0ABQ5C9K3_9ASTR
MIITNNVVGYNTKGATMTNLSLYGSGCLSRFQMLPSMLSPTNSLCSSGGGTDGGSDGDSGLDLLRDEDGNSNESSGYQVDDGAALRRFMATL